MVYFTNISSHFNAKSFFSTFISFPLFAILPLTFAFEYSIPIPYCEFFLKNSREHLPLHLDTLSWRSPTQPSERGECHKTSSFVGAVLFCRSRCSFLLGNKDDVLTFKRKLTWKARVWAHELFTIPYLPASYIPSIPSADHMHHQLKKRKPKLSPNGYTQHTQ